MNPRLTIFWRRLKTFFVGVSAFLCIAVMVAWGLAIAGWRFECGTPDVLMFRFEVSGYRGGVQMRELEMSVVSSLQKKWRYDVTLVPVDFMSKNPRSNIFILPAFVFSDESISNAGRFSGVASFNYPKAIHSLILPYWLLIAVFATAPVMRLWRCHVQRRDKEFFEEIVAAKRKEQSEKASLAGNE